MITQFGSLLCSFLVIHYTYGVDMDYYFGSALRSLSRATCSGKSLLKMRCEIACSSMTGMCIGTNCYCLLVKKVDNFELNNANGTLRHPEQSDSENDFRNSVERPRSHKQQRQRPKTVKPEGVEYLDESLLVSVPVLRHHIAHFCPNLDIARDCIRTCMKEGKPAFCGKDHVCYCGHKYGSTDQKQNVNVNNMYAQFKDLYEKYFGPKAHPHNINV